MGMQECLLAVREAAKDKLTPAELDAIEQRAAQIKKRVEAEGNLDDLNERIRQATQEEADRVKIAAALQRKHAALNAIVRDRLQSHVEGLMAAGYSPSKAVLSVFEGTQQGVANARKSVYALRQAYETRYMFGMLAALQKERPHLKALVDDKDLSGDIVREMYELRQGGSPGSTGNADAQFVAKVFSGFAELSRTDLNKRGAAIGKLDGWAGPQRHDPGKIAKADADTWANDTLALLDLKRTFPEITTVKEATDMLKEIRTTILTGMGDGVTPASKGQRVGPASLAKSLGRSRVLHFKDADAWLSYNEKYGDGGIFQAMIAHQQRAASNAAQLDTFGPNPEVMLGGYLDTLRHQVRDDPKMSAKDKEAEIKRLDLGTGGRSGTAIAHAFLDMRGLVSAPANLKLAQIGQTTRNIVAMQSLGGAVLSSVPSDLFTMASAGMFRGEGFFRTFGRSLAGLLAGKPKGEQHQISLLLGEGADALIGEINRPYISHDGVPGGLHKLTTAFFQWNGLSWTTDVERAVHGRMLAAELAQHSQNAWADINPRFRHVMELQGIDEGKWRAIRKGAFLQDNGVSYVTPDAMRNLADDDLAHLIAPRMASLTTKDPARIEAARQRFLDDARTNLELDLGRFFADETNYAVVETDAASRRITTWGGLQSGTVAGELARTIMQFKGFPIAFTQRVVGRALFGGIGDTKGQRLMSNLPHIGMLLAGLTAAGYLSIVAKDLAKGQWPPRNPSDPRVLAASALQGGAFGIYGDFLFGESNRFGASPLETAAGPAAGRVSDIIQLYQSAVHGETRAGNALNTIIENTPFANLFYARWALDAMWLNGMREWASPGYRRRQERNIQQQYGQQYLFGAP